jgi:Zn-finger nucleic acid-binding protein
MQCQINRTALVMTDRNGVEIDYCPHCHGVWLDRGALDKIIERSVCHVSTPPQQRGYDDRRQKKKKRDSFPSDIFDF